MTTYINEDHELRLIWYKYQNMLTVHDRSRSMCRDEQSLFEWEQSRRCLESRSRAEILKTRRNIRIENAKRKEIRKNERKNKENQPENIS